MSLRIAGHRDHYAGVLMALIGLGTIAQSSRYDLGTSEQLGPGFFPMALGCVLMAIGVLIFVSAGSGAASGSDDAMHEVGTPEWRGWFCIILGTISFIVLAERIGLLIATFACVFISALGDRTSTLKNAFLLAAAISLLGVALFSYGLQIPLPAIAW